MTIHRSARGMLLVAILIAAAAMSAGSLLAGQGEDPLAGLDLEHLLRLLHRAAELLELTPGQRAEIALILAEELPGIRDLAGQLAAARRDYWSDHELGSFDEGEYRPFLESQSPLEIELRVASVRTMSRLWNVLDAGQQQRLLRLIRAMADGNGPRHGANRVAP